MEFRGRVVKWWQILLAWNVGGGVLVYALRILGVI